MHNAAIIDVIVHLHLYLQTLLGEENTNFCDGLSLRSNRSSTIETADKKKKKKKRNSQVVIYLLLTQCHRVLSGKLESQMFRSFLGSSSIALLKYFVVLGADMEYTCVLVIVTCMGIHLFILMTQPRCLRVMKEENQKRYRRIQKLYPIASFLATIFLYHGRSSRHNAGMGRINICVGWQTFNCNSSSIRSVADVPCLGCSRLGHGGGSHRICLFTILFTSEDLKKHQANSHGERHVHNMVDCLNYKL